MKRILSIISLCAIAFIAFFGCGEKPKINSLKLSFDFVINDTLEDGNNKNVKVIILAGQSNATGVAHTTILKEKVSEEKYNEYVAGQKNVYINYNTENGLNKSDGFVHTNVESYYVFGPEIGLSEILGQEQDEYYIIKYSYGGSNLYEHWKKENQCLYKGLVKYTKQSIDYLKSKNYNPNIVAMCWMQGESDAFGETSKKYFENTKKFVSSIRQEFGNIKWIDAGISDCYYWKEYKTINECKLMFSTLADNNYYIDTIAENLTYNLEPQDSPDLAHYDVLSQIKLGHLFAKAVIDQSY